MESVKVAKAKGLGRRGYQWIEVLSFEPRLCLYHNFLSMEECEHLINLGKPHMKRSVLYDKKNPESDGKISSNRTSTGAFLNRAEDEVTRNIEKRIADCTSLPVENGEGLQVLHYQVGQKVGIHSDYNEDSKGKFTSQRNITVLMYLSNVEEGGETYFPYAKHSYNLRPRGLNKGGIYVKPSMCDALIFWNMKPDGRVDPMSIHGSAPVIRGNKWACTQWMHDTEYEPPTRTQTLIPTPRRTRTLIPKPPTPGEWCCLALLTLLLLTLLFRILLIFLCESQGNGKNDA